MTQRPSGGEINESYDTFISMGAWFAALLYGAPAAIILAVFWLADVPEKFWIPVLLIYLVGAVAHMMNYGFVAVNIQTKVSTDLMIDEIRLLKK